MKWRSVYSVELTYSDCTKRYESIKAQSKDKAKEKAETNYPGTKCTSVTFKYSY